MHDFMNSKLVFTAIYDSICNLKKPEIYEIYRQNSQIAGIKLSVGSVTILRLQNPVTNQNRIYQLPLFSTNYLCTLASYGIFLFVGSRIQSAN